MLTCFVLRCLYGYTDSFPLRSPCLVSPTHNDAIDVHDTGAHAWLDKDDNAKAYADVYHRLGKFYTKSYDAIKA